MNTAKRAIYFRWSDNRSKVLPDDRTQAARIIRAHRAGRANGSAVVGYDRAGKTITVGLAARGAVHGIFTRHSEGHRP